jgi:hypothetical protein
MKPLPMIPNLIAFAIARVHLSGREMRGAFAR